MLSKALFVTVRLSLSICHVVSRGGRACPGAWWPAPGQTLVFFETNSLLSALQLVGLAETWLSRSLNTPGEPLSQ